MMASSLSALPRLEHYVLTERLGQGTYAVVYKAYKKGNRREAVAVKYIKRSSLTKRATDNLMTEIEILKRLKHRHIVELYDFEWDAHGIYLIMEFCGGGDLSDFIRSRKTLPEKVARKFVRQLASALNFLREQNIAHMDLKPQNLLLSSKIKPVLKLADFGFAQYMKSDSDTTELRGSPLYMAPEMFLSDHYDSSVDLWSVGVILYEAVYGVAPYASETYAELVEKIQDESAIVLPNSVGVSSSCRNLLSGLLERDPSKRIAFADFFAHPFIDLEHVPGADCFKKAIDIVTKAVQKDAEGDYALAAHFYCESLDYFLPAIQFETDPGKKEAIRAKIQQYLDRVDYLRRIIEGAWQAHNDEKGLVELANKRPEIKPYVEQLEKAQKAKEENRLDNALKMYQSSLEGLLSALPTASGEDHRLLRTEINCHLKVAEDIKTLIDIEASKKEADFDLEPASPSSSKLECCIQ
ncbi:serine/threonine-protein kinase ULK3-like isoform X2 [Oscarella lobularis]|uniref:serine/threonine-protein kinase ULK3-like isoform X2 n=1 Tax=Oscarella lobularis TaxID=121494 RepID=UPI00331377E6